MNLASRLKIAADWTKWRAVKLLTDLTWNTEQGRVFCASKRVDVNSDQYLYIQFETGAEKTVRFYCLVIAADASTNIDKVDAGAEPGLNGSDMLIEKPNPNGESESLVTYSVEDAELSGEETAGESFIPARRGPQSAGGISDSNTYRVLVPGDNPTLFKIYPASDEDVTVAVQILWSENDG